LSNAGELELQGCIGANAIQNRFADREFRVGLERGSIGEIQFTVIAFGFDSPKESAPAPSAPMTPAVFESTWSAMLFQPTGSSVRFFRGKRIAVEGHRGVNEVMNVSRSVDVDPEFKLVRRLRGVRQAGQDRHRQ
jgi:hypothetical protein